MLRAAEDSPDISLAKAASRRWSLPT